MESKTLLFLRKTVDAEGQKVLDIFEHELEKEMDLPFEDQLKYFLEEYCNNCGISYSYRSVYWDMGQFIVQSKFGIDSEIWLDDYAKEYVPNWDEFRTFDAGMQLEPTVVIAFKMLYTGEVRDEYKTFFAKTLEKFINAYENIDEEELMKEWDSTFKNTYI